MSLTQVWSPLHGEGLLQSQPPHPHAQSPQMPLLQEYADWHGDELLHSQPSHLWVTAIIGLTLSALRSSTTYDNLPPCTDIGMVIVNALASRLRRGGATWKYTNEIPILFGRIAIGSLNGSFHVALGTAESKSKAIIASVTTASTTSRTIAAWDELPVGLQITLAILFNRLGTQGDNTKFGIRKGLYGGHN